MNKVSKILFGIILILLIIVSILYFKLNIKYNDLKINSEKILTKEEKNKKVEDKSKTTEKITDKVIIKDGKIQNEKLIFDYISCFEKNYWAYNENKKITILEYSDENSYVEKYLEFFPGNYAKRESGETIPAPKHGSESNYESEKEEYGYYNFYDGNKINEHRADVVVPDIVTKDNIVKFVLNYTPYVEVEKQNFEDLPTICSYNLENSGYTKNFELAFFQRKDLGIDKVYKEDGISLYTFGGDVKITKDDNTYNLKEALENKFINMDNIISQAELDKIYGLCNSDMLRDGGSLFYDYDNYSIYKMNSLDGMKDIIIGFKGMSIDEFKKILNQQ